MKWEEVDRARYERGVRSGWTAERTVAEALHDGVGEIHAIRLVRVLFGIDLVQAKELIVRVERGGSNLADHQGTLLPALQRAFGDEEASSTRTPEASDDTSPDSHGPVVPNNKSSRGGRGHWS
jgi:hypothetical protein